LTLASRRDDLEEVGLGIADVIAALVYQRSLTQNATANSSCNPSTVRS